MPMHPGPPTDLAGLVDAYEQTSRAVVDLGLTCSPADFDLQTECPGWTVKDQISHIVGIEAWLDGAEPPELDLPKLPHVKNAMGAFVEPFVEERRTRGGTEVVRELEEVLGRRLAQLRDPALTEETVVRGVLGPAPAPEALRLRVSDIWVHEQDIRTAIGRPGNLDSAAAAVFVSAVVAAFPRVVARDAAVPVGYAVILDVTGPVVARCGARVLRGPDHKPWGEPLFTGGSHDADAASAPVETTSIILSTDALTRRAAGRRSVEDLTYSVHGDDEVARTVLEHLVIVH